ncbi:MAG: DUF1624 domain-containing protein [Candidatus Aenigmarchaeota archaeon]|nr:DUF1624 domain-containing protein [Candidatus Aenigmarchaeota archaeon]
MARFWELDAARGLAVICMVAFNWSFALRYLGVYTFTDGWLYWWLFPRSVAGAFILIAGISLALSMARKRPYGHFLKRGLSIFGLGLLVTAGVWLYLGQPLITFGILHFIGVAVVLAPAFAPLGKWNLLLGLLLIGLGAYAGVQEVDVPWLFWLGLKDGGYAALDYFPLLPWFGLFLIGLAVGQIRYAGKKAPKSSDKLGMRQLAGLGQHSLAIYLVHQPLLVGLLLLFGLA